jgi:hypothetical protein
METCWNVTIEDTSPLFKYSPYTDGGAEGWTGTFAGGQQVVNGVTIGTGNSQHVTAGQSGAEIIFNGESQGRRKPEQLNQYFSRHGNLPQWCNYGEYAI